MDRIPFIMMCLPLFACFVPLPCLDGLLRVRLAWGGVEGRHRQLGNQEPGGWPDIVIFINYYVWWFVAGFGELVCGAPDQTQGSLGGVWELMITETSQLARSGV